MTLQAKPLLLLVKVPLQVTDADIKAFLTCHELWIRKACQFVDERLFLLGTPVDWTSLTHGHFCLPTPLLERDRSKIHKRLCHQAITDQFNLTVQRLALGFIPFRICSMASAWGKCHSSGRLEIHWQTGTLPAYLIDYIICHEIAHKTYFDHSQNFWAYLDTLHSGARKHDRALKKWRLR